MRTHIRGIALTTLLLSPVTASADAELVTDRPDQTESAVVVPTGSWQVEVGWTLTSDDENGADVEILELPGTLARYGITDRLELRLGWSGYGRVDTTTTAGKTRFDGAQDADLGFKVLLQEGDVQSALLIGASLPVGDDELTSDRVDPNFRFSVSYDLSDKWSLGYNVGAGWQTSDGDTTVQGLYTLAVGTSLGERWGAFLEIYGEGAGGGPPSHAIDGGVTWLLRPNLQLDAALGLGLSDAADDAFVGVGLSVRWPN